MLCIGKIPIIVPTSADVIIDGPLVTVRGKRGELSHTIPASIMVALKEGQTPVFRSDNERVSRSLHGLTRTLIVSMIAGVAEGYKKSLEVMSTGYHTVARSKSLEFVLGLSHPVIIEPAEGIEFTVESQTKSMIHGIGRQLVGETAAHIRKLKRSEPYKGKGIHYVGGTIRRRVGKTDK